MARGPDILPVQSIPLSATSDQPVEAVPGPPINASGNADDLKAGVAREISAEELAAAAAVRKGDLATSDIKEPPAKTEKTPPKDAKTVETDDDGIEVDPRTPNFAVQEITKVRRITRERVAAAQAEVKKAADEAVAAKAEAETVRKELEALRAKVPAAPETPKVEVDPRPTRDAFDDPDAYDEAITAWADREGDRKAAAKVAEADAARKKADDDAAAEKKAADDKVAADARTAELQTINDAWEASVAAAKTEKYEDWDDVVMKSPEEGGPTISDVMGAIMIQQPNGTDIAYYLAQNTDESKRIASIANPFLQAAEIGALSRQLAQPARTAVRRRPIDPVNTNISAPETPDPDGDDMDTYYKNHPSTRQTRPAFFPPGGVH